jgi:hypothetical protein
MREFDGFELRGAKEEVESALENAISQNVAVGRARSTSRETQPANYSAGFACAGCCSRIQGAASSERSIAVRWPPPQIQKAGVGQPETFRGSWDRLISGELRAGRGLSGQVFSTTDNAAEPVFVRNAPEASSPRP